MLMVMFMGFPDAAVYQWVMYFGSPDLFRIGVIL